MAPWPANTRYSSMRRCGDIAAPVFRPVTNNRTGDFDGPLSVYHNIVWKYGLETGISGEVNGLCVHSLRAPRPPPTRSLVRPISPRCWSGSVTPTSPRLSCLYGHRAQKPLENQPEYAVASSLRIFLHESAWYPIIARELPKPLRREPK